MRPLAGQLVVLALILASCTSSTHAPAASREATRSPARRAAQPRAPDRRTPAALKHIAQMFNDDYQNGMYPPVYARWDPASQAIISEAGYVRRHTECGSNAGTRAAVETVTPGPHGFWLVRYEIGGLQFVDYWIYEAGRWRFDLLRSNPSAVKQYRMSFAQYAKALGCRP